MEIFLIKQVSTSSSGAPTRCWLARILHARSDTSAHAPVEKETMESFFFLVYVCFNIIIQTYIGTRC